MRALLLLAVLLAACTSRASCPAGDLSLPPSASFAVLRSDGSSSAVALVAADGTIVSRDLVDSGTHVSSLVTTLAGDAALPSSPLGPRTVAWLDRLDADVLSLASSSGALEVDTRGESLDTPHTGFSANPHDALVLEDGRILVARYGVNADASAPELQRGNDVVVLENVPGSAGLTVTQRVDVHADETLDASRCTDGECVVYARPALLIERTSGSAQRIVVVLDRLSSRFRRGADGAIVTLDPETLAVSAPLTFAGLLNCYFAAADPSDSSRLYVLCSGATYATEDERRASAGVVEVTVGPDGSASESRRFTPGTADPVPFNGLVAVGGGRVLYVASGSLDVSPAIVDRLVTLELASGAAEIVYRASTAFVLGDGFAATGGALVPDAAANAILRVSVDSSGAHVAGSVPFDDCVGLPPIQIRPLAF